jgi:hypothetical protein
LALGSSFALALCAPMGYACTGHHITGRLAMTDFNQLLLQVREQAGPLVLVLGVLFIIVLALGIVLRTACSLYNSLVGGRDAADNVPMPSVVGSMVMVFLSFVLTFGLVLGILWVGANLALAINLNPSELALYSGLGTLVLFFVVLSILLSMFLPAPIFRSFIIAVLCVPVGIILFVAFIGIIWLISFLFNFTFPAFEHLPWGRK